MRLCFLGHSHAANHLAHAAFEKGFNLVDAVDADLVFVSQDTPTYEDGCRDLGAIRALVLKAKEAGKPTVLTSAVPPGFTRSCGRELGWGMWHQAETLRIKDAEERARNPEQIIVGGPEASALPLQGLPAAYVKYLMAFRCPILRMTWEEAEFAKVAINCTLAAQVENTNRLAAAAVKVGAEWRRIVEVLKNDGRIGPKSYLEPGRWQESSHLLRDMRTLKEIEE